MPIELCICEDDGSDNRTTDCRTTAWRSAPPTESALPLLKPGRNKGGPGAAEGLPRQRDRLNGERRPQEALPPRQNADSRITQRLWRMPGGVQEGTRRGPRRHNSYGSLLRTAHCLYLRPCSRGSEADRQGHATGSQRMTVRCSRS